MVEFRLGDPDDEGGERLRLSSSTVRETTLSTYDDAEFFIIRISIGEHVIQVQDSASGPP